MPYKTEKELRAKASRYLEANAVKSTCFNPSIEKNVPRFEPREIETGMFLGQGGFCVVSEVSNITLKRPEDEETKDENCNIDSDGSKLVQDRKFIASHLFRDECSRYAIKMLSPTLHKKSNGTFLSGVIDLAMEVKYLAIIQHPHIIKMRAISSAHPCSDQFFIVLDRLYETLTERLSTWKKSVKKLTGLTGSLRRLGGGQGKGEKGSMLAERLVVAHDICSALAFLHSKRISYRDVKPDNIGFDVRGDVKIFDFGLAKELMERNRVEGTSTFNMTKRCGSPRYMAPEVFKGYPYNHNVDVYSFGLLLWQICECKTPFEDFNYDSLAEQVMYGNERPVVNPKWSPVVRNLITSSWHYDFSKRPECEDIGASLKGEIVGLCGEQILDELDFTGRTEASFCGRK